MAFCETGVLKGQVRNIPEKVQGKDIGEKTAEEEDPRFKIVHPTVNTTTATSVKPVSKAQILMEVWNLVGDKTLHFCPLGGWYMPTGCIGGTRTAIIIPFRNREQHLPVMLRQLHAVLRHQQIHYRIFVIEQSDEHPFNRGKIRNIGFKEALRYFPYTCFVFHDVDLVPENDRILRLS
ncbi:beta-1,4-N-acetylgalactosaminyltransferase bre-4-like [Clytia hemisphaerica]|uniref:beta-1,4-N-acetylgalactosaminyltransferase bre-4-like n=1 Tax=Clytia hemisphaerica TaxID=252671 RepID=UPI0034D53B93